MYEDKMQENSKKSKIAIESYEKIIEKQKF